MNLTKQQITDIFATTGSKTPYADGMMMIKTETGGNAFLPSATGQMRIVIQFEPTVFSKYLTAYKIAHTLTKKVLKDVTYYGIDVIKKPLLVSKGLKDDSGSWHIINGVEGQEKEYQAFSIAMQIHPLAAMFSTSWGLGQMMGYQFSRLGYKTVNAMIDAFKASEYEQVKSIAVFIKTDKNLLKDFLDHNFKGVAYRYNGSNYAINSYDKKLEANRKLYLA